MAEPGRALHHLALGARDVERVASFYLDLFGLPELARHHDAAGELRSVWLGLGGSAGVMASFYGMKAFMPGAMLRMDACCKKTIDRCFRHDYVDMAIGASDIAVNQARIVSKRKQISLPPENK